MYFSKLPGMTGNVDVHSNVYEHQRVGLKVIAGDRCDVCIRIDENRQVGLNIMNLRLP
jgi:hypothetical protein